MKALIGKKIGMTQIYDEQGTLIPVTVIEAGPCVVTAVKTVERDGYDALQLGFGARKAKNLSRAEKGHLTKAVAVDEAGKLPAVLREFRGMEAAEPGTVLNVGVFAAGDYLDVVGTTKGRGFQGVVKRWNFGGGRASHGGAWERRPGSIGCCEFPGRVAKGKKMAGHYGCDRRTIQNLKVVRVNVEENYLLVKGAVPGANGGILLVRSALKKSAK
jgi:large subunit ribosomal protein L3